jgi:hypothetical protein
MAGLVCLGLAGFGLVLALFGLMTVLRHRTAGFWYSLAALVLSGSAILNGLTLFIATLVMDR